MTVSPAAMGAVPVMRPVVDWPKATPDREAATAAHNKVRRRMGRGIMGMLREGLVCDSGISIDSKERQRTAFLARSCFRRRRFRPRPYEWRRSRVTFPNDGR